MDPSARDAELIGIYSEELIEIAHAMEALTVRLNRFRYEFTWEEQIRIKKITDAAGRVSSATRKMGNDLRPGNGPVRGGKR